MKCAENQVRKRCDIRCMHYIGEGYRYDLSDNEELLLCDQCNLNLVGEVAKQQAIETFSNTMIHAMEAKK